MSVFPNHIADLVKDTITTKLASVTFLDKCRFRNYYHAQDTILHKERGFRRMIRVCHFKARIWQISGGQTTKDDEGQELFSFCNSLTWITDWG